MKQPNPSLLKQEVQPEEVERRLSFSAAVELCANVAGYDLDKQSCADLGMDKARWSRIKAGQEGIKWEQLQSFMDACGNDAPLLWMLHQRGYELRTIKKRETEYERRIRELEEQIAREKVEREVVEQTMRRIIAGAAA